MPTDVSLRLADPAAMAVGDNTLFTVAEGHTVIVQRFHVVNSTSSTKITVKVGLNASADANLITPSMTIPGKQMADVDTYVVMTASENVADSLVLNASATGVTVTVYGVNRYPHF